MQKGKVHKVEITLLITYQCSLSLYMKWSSNRFLDLELMPSYCQKVNLETWELNYVQYKWLLVEVHHINLSYLLIGNNRKYLQLEE